MKHPRSSSAQNEDSCSELWRSGSGEFRRLRILDGLQLRHRDVFDTGSHRYHMS